MPRRAPLILVLLAVVGVVAGLVWMSDSGTDRTDRTGEAARSRRVAAGGEEQAVDSPRGRVADAATLAELIARHGGFETKGRVFLTRPTAAAANVRVVLSADLDGHRVEARAQSDSEGRFALVRLPRGTDYRLAIDGDRVQPLRETLAEPAGAEADLGDLFLDRLYYLTGKVVSGSGIAVPDAEVAVIVPNGGTEGFSWRSRTTSAGEADPVVASTATGGDGRFTLELKDPGIFHVRVRAKNWAPHYRDDVFVGAGADTEIRVALTRGVEVGGIVLDATGRPLPKATVSLFPNSRNWWSQVKELSETGDDGRFDFRIEPRSDRYQILVSPPDGVDVNRAFSLPLTEELVIRLPGGATLKGRVVDADTSQPIANADIIVSLKGPGATQMQGAYQKALTTDAYGVFRLAGVGTDGLQALAVSAQGYAHFVGSGWSRDPAWQEMSKVRFTADAEVQLPDVPLKRGRIVEGVVRDAETQQPIPAATVTLRDWILGDRRIRTGADGRYRFEDIGDRVSLTADAPGFVDVSSGGWGGEPLPAGQDVVQRDFELQLAGSVSGTVRTSAGQPVARALVRLRSAEQGRGGWMADLRLRDHFTHTDESGRFTLEGVPPVSLKVEASTPGFDAGESDTRKLEPGMRADGLDVKLVTSARVSGVVMARGAGAVANARITIAKDSGADDPASRWRSLAGGKVAFSDEKGRFAADDVPSGDLVLRVEADGHATETVRRKGVEPGSEVGNLVVTLKPALEIGGRVLDENGEPMSRAWVRARQTSAVDGAPSDQLLGARVQEDGSFTLRNIAEGGYTLEVQVWSRGDQPQYEPHSRAGVVAGTKDVVMRLKLRE
jgi:protocatechuate 3,4-dioxygenase beta subunit